jgi:hypothetical protein
MIPALRTRFNREFSPARYEAFLADVERRAGVPVTFRLSETPCFFPVSVLERFAAVGLELVDQLLTSPDYLRAANAIVPDHFRVSRGEDWPTFVQVDFGFVSTPNGLEGRLVELQAFPSLFGFQVVLAAASLELYGLGGLTPFLSGLDREEYLGLLRRLLIADHDPAEVILMDIDPPHQKTFADFAVTERFWGIRALDPSNVRRDGRQLWYRKDGRRQRIARIYNRIVPDELERAGAALPFDYRDDLDVEWIGGPDWYFRMSKFSIPWLAHPWVPETQYLSDLQAMPHDRDQWVLKPLFSFAGGGIIFGPSDQQLGEIPADRRHLYILQRRVAFTPVIETPEGPTQAEVRVMLVRDGDRYRPVMPLVRMGRGRMMGVDHNKGLAWVGAAAGLMPVDGEPAFEVRS